jgi:hypothetical protein
MDSLADLFTILLLLSGFFSILTLVCTFFERLPAWFDAGSRRRRALPDRPSRRSRVARPRRTQPRPVPNEQVASLSRSTDSATKLLRQNLHQPIAHRPNLIC